MRVVENVLSLTKILGLLYNSCLRMNLIFTEINTV